MSLFFDFLDTVARERKSGSAGLLSGDIDSVSRAEAIALAKRAPPDLILSDIRLADGSSGAEATGTILEEREVPVIFLTACPHEVPPLLREAAFVIAKPYNEATVKMTIEQAVSRQCDCPKLRDCICPAIQPPF